MRIDRRASDMGEENDSSEWAVAPHSRNSKILQTMALHFDLSDRYKSEIDRLATRIKLDENLDLKQLLQYINTLKNEEAMLVLSLIWRESHFISKEDLMEAGAKRMFESEEMTAWGIALFIARTKGEIGATSSRIRRICVAAVRFGLIQMTEKGNKSPISGMPLLHETMKRIATT